MALGWLCSDGNVTWGAAFRSNSRAEQGFSALGLGVAYVTFTGWGRCSVFPFWPFYELLHVSENRWTLSIMTKHLDLVFINEKVLLQSVILCVIT